jgi:hypothetical protein
VSWTEPIPVVHDEPVSRGAVEECVQMLGHDPMTTAAVFIEARVTGDGDVVRVIVREAGALVEHRHVIL